MKNIKTGSLLLLTFFIYNSAAIAQFSAATIAEALKKDADMVIRFDEQSIEFKGESSIVLKRKYVYTILNSSGDRYAKFVSHYDKLGKIVDVDGTLYNAAGIKIRSLKKNEVKDYSNTSESNLVDDDRVKFHDFGYHIYPYTIAYESTEEWNGTFSLPAWIPVKNERVSVEKSTFIVTTAAGYSLRHKAFNLPMKPETGTTKNSTTYKWEINNYGAVSEEPYSPAWHEITPSVYVAPSSFAMQKYSGSMTDWKGFGAFIYQLNANRDLLPEKIKQTVHSLTDHVSNPAEKAAILYKYLQKNTRYISIQMGIGGWQTLDAGFVASNGYGDCKALNNYMYAMLKEAGVKSYYTLVHAGRGKQSFMADFASNQFNHIILCVPVQKDTIWLECTDQKTPTGYLGSFTNNRPVLLIDEQGGILTRTPDYSKTDNLQIRNVDASIDEEGTLTAQVKTSYRAEQQDHLFSILHNGSQKDIDDYMKNKFTLASYQVDKFNHEEVMSTLPVIHENVTLTAKNCASISGKRIFINPNVLSASGIKIKNAEERKYDFQINYSFTDYDTVYIKIPAGYVAESIPADVKLDMPLAQYQSSIKLDKEKIVYVRSYTQTNGRMQVTEAKNVAAFFDKVYKADHAKLVFVKETN